MVLQKAEIRVTNDFTSRLFLSLISRPKFLSLVTLSLFCFTPAIVISDGDIPGIWWDAGYSSSFLTMPPSGNGRIIDWHQKWPGHSDMMLTPSSCTVVGQGLSISCSSTSCGGGFGCNLSCPQGTTLNQAGTGCNVDNGPDEIDPEIDSPDCSCESAKCSGDPISHTTGSNVQMETDYRGSGAFPLLFQRSYVSYVDEGSFVTAKWSTSYSQSISVSPGQLILVKRNNGITYRFYELQGQLRPVYENIVHTLVVQPDNGYVFTLDNGIREYYDAHGKLTEIKNLYGLTQTLTYFESGLHQGLLKNVVDNEGNSLSFNYIDGKISSFTDSSSNTYIYTYSGNLIASVSVLGEIQSRVYHYENASFPELLTGITDENGVRYVTWEYDIQGRAIANELANGTDRVTLVFNDDSSTTVTNSLGKRTTYHYSPISGVRKITHNEGHPSANCAAANKNYTYYPSGLLQTKTDWQGSTTSYQYNTRNLESSRTEAVGTPQERTITTEWHPTFNLRTKITEPGKETIFTYDAQGRLTAQSVNDLPMN